MSAANMFHSCIHISFLSWLVIQLVHGFQMGSNWFLVSTVFFTTRESILTFRDRFLSNNDDPVKRIVSRDWNEMIASAGSGAFVGGITGWIWRGPMAIPAGVIMYAGITSTGQFIYSSARWYRMKEAWKIHQQQQHQQLFQPYESSLPPTPAPHKESYWRRTAAFRQDHNKDPKEASDPIKFVFDFIISQVRYHLDGLPEWASPLANAIDVEYRKRLNVRIRILEDQIEELQEKVQSNNNNSSRNSNHISNCCNNSTVVVLVQS